MSWKPSILGCAGCLALLAAFDLYAGTIAPPLQAKLDRVAETDRVAVIIRYRDQVNFKSFRDRKLSARRENFIRALRNRADIDQRQTRNLLAGMGARSVRELWLINALALEIPASAINALANLPGVRSVSLDRQVRLARTTVSGIAACGVSPAAWNIDAIRAPELWAMGYTGEGIVVATMDSGADNNHPDLTGSWRGGSNSWFDPNGEHLTPYDASGHGTWALGLLVGGASSGTPVGVATGAKWISVKIFDDSGVAQLSDIHAGFQWLLDPDGDPATDDAPDIVNNSWFLSGALNECDPEFHADVAALKTAGIGVVFAAGNTGPGPATSVSPANDPQSLAVGSVGEAFGFLFIDNESARGPSACDGSVYPHVAAPGANVLTADRTFGGLFPNSYVCVSGTSFSAPHVSGAMAVLIGAMNDLGTPVPVSQIETALKEKAVDMGDPGPDNEWGAGLLDVAGALDWLIEHNGSLDLDDDGYTQDVDCNDYDASVHPGAAEIAHDNIDQDCNGHDLTIDITRARYRLANDYLTIHARSELNITADLSITINLIDGQSITRDMIWNAAQNRWQRTITRFTRKFQAWPMSVTVSGIEGSAASPIAIGRVSRRVDRERQRSDRRNPRNVIPR